MEQKQALLRRLPAVDRILQEPVLRDLQQSLPRRLILAAVQDTLDEYRRRLIAPGESKKDQKTGTVRIDLAPAALAVRAAARAAASGRPSLRRVINASGIVLHTNLGRAPLAASAVEAMVSVAAGYSNLELDLDSGERGSRQAHVEKLLCDLSGAEAALVVNNNAAAVLLALHTLAREREVIVSRGQLVEIGGSFRLPEVMAAGGARLIEVGTTNKVHRRDYEDAINPHTALLLKVHTSNYCIVGFTAAVGAAELVSLARERQLLVMEDLGSGVFLDTTAAGLPFEPRVQDSVAAGIDVVTFSGDKLLGGLQAGIIVGRSGSVDRIRRNQLARALRVGKITLAALEATLRLYLEEDRARQKIPVWQMLCAPSSSLKRRATALARRLRDIIGLDSVEVLAGVSKVGGGAMPLADLPTFLVALTPMAGDAAEAAARLRQGDPPVIARLQHDRILLDLRTVLPGEEKILAAAVVKSLPPPCGREKGQEL